MPKPITNRLSLTAIVALLLTLFCVVPASAAPALVQSKDCAGGSGTCSFTSTPANGNVVAAVLTSGGAGLPSVTVKDSNSVFLTQRTISSTCAGNGHCAAVYDYVVSGSPSATYTISDTNEYSIDFYEISGTNGVGASASYAQNGTTNSGATLTATLGVGVSANDIQLCGGLVGSATTQTITFSNGTTTTDRADSNVAIGHATASLTLSSTCTMGALSLGGSGGVAYGDYTAGGTTTTSGCPPYQYPCPFKPA